MDDEQSYGYTGETILLFQIVLCGVLSKLFIEKQLCLFTC